MKLRNKKTGEVVEPLSSGPIDLYFYLNKYEENEVDRKTYQSLAELNADWEDYAPKEPLIKDKKIRKAVRAWAEANNIRAVYYSPEEDGFYVKNFDDEIVTSIYFADKPMEEDGYGEHYTIAELCGEEEE